MRIGLVVERRYFPEAVASVEGLRLGKGFVGFEPEQRKAPFPREVFEAEQDPGAKPETAGGGRDPHPLDLAIGRMTLQGAAPDRLSVQDGHNEVAPRRRELRRRGRYAERRIVAGFEPGPQLLEVALDRKSTRLNSSHGYISYAVFCLKKKNRNQQMSKAITH